MKTNTSLGLKVIFYLKMNKYNVNENHEKVAFLHVSLKKKIL